MARIVIAARGTMGDHVPFIGLGAALRSEHFDVQLAINPAMSALARRAGLRVVPVGRALGSDVARRLAADWDHWETVPWPRLLGPAAIEQDVQWCIDLAGACVDADALVAGTTCQHLAAMVSELTGVPWVLVSLMPAATAAPSRAANSATGPAKDVAAAQITFLNTIRQRLRLPIVENDSAGLVAPAKTLLASSPHFSGSRIPPDVAQSGFWFVQDPSTADYRPDEAILRFLDHEPPLVLSFSSQPLIDPAAALNVYAGAAQVLGRRLVVLRGWAGFERRRLDPALETSPLIHFADAVPHSWLLPRAAAIICHGGIGTIAEAIRASCPVAVVPYGNDQYFNALRVVQLGIGAAIHPHRANPAAVARLLNSAVLDDTTHARINTLASEIRLEQGLHTAVATLSCWIGSPSTFPRDT